MRINVSEVIFKMIPEYLHLSSCPSSVASPSPHGVPYQYSRSMLAMWVFLNEGAF